MADLTRDEILAMPAGREMDRIVAERVLSLEIVCHADFWGPDHPHIKPGLTEFVRLNG